MQMQSSSRALFACHFLPCLGFIIRDVSVDDEDDDPDDSPKIEN